jgi:hypothetical protein
LVAGGGGVSHILLGCGQIRPMRRIDVTHPPDDLAALRRSAQPENQPYSAEREEEYKSKFPYLSMSAEEYVARNSQTIFCFSLHRYEYRDSRLKRWLQEVFDLLCNRERVEEVRRLYLTPAEITAAQQAEQEV